MKTRLLLEGLTACPGVSTGIARVVLDPSKYYDTFNYGEILVVKRTTPDYFYLLALSGGMIGEVGGRTCHLAVNALELNKPCIVGAETATETIQDGMLIYLDATNGKVYEIL